MVDWLIGEETFQSLKNLKTWKSLNIKLKHSIGFVKASCNMYFPKYQKQSTKNKVQKTNIFNIKNPCFIRVNQWQKNYWLLGDIQ